MTPRAKFIKDREDKKLAGMVWDAMVMASTHDPDHERRLSIIERQMKRIGAPRYRSLCHGR